MNEWLCKAAGLPIAFSQVREDPRIDMECCRQLSPGASVVMIASGGDTAVCLAKLPLGRLVVVDMNPAQLALTQCKLHLAGTATRDEALEWLGHRSLSVEERACRIAATLKSLGLPADALGPLDAVSLHGPDFAGRYEFLFAALRDRLAPISSDIRRWLESERPVTIPADSEFDAAFVEVMSLQNLVTLFGREATLNPRKPFAAHFAERARVAFSRNSPCVNPFLWQIFAGIFPPNVAWDWHAELSGLRADIVFIQGRMKEALDCISEGSVDFVQLSNVLDWLAPVEATEVLVSAHRALKPGGRVLIRQLNSSLDIPGLPSGFQWDAASGAAMEASDRSFFYPTIHLGQRR